METKTENKWINLFIKIVLWFKTAFEENKGKVSIKRVIAFMLAQTSCFVIIYITVKNDLSKFQWESTCLLLGALFTQISALIAASVIEKKHILTNTPSGDQQNSSS